MATRKDLTDSEILRFLRFSVTESAAATFTQGTYDTQLSIDRGIIWLIRWVEWDLNISGFDDVAQNTAETISAQIARESQTAISNYNDPDIIAKHVKYWKRVATIGTEAGPMWVVDDIPFVQHFDPPLPYAAQEIHIGIKSTRSSATTITGRVAYTLRRVSDKFFYRVAQALIS